MLRKKKPMAWVHLFIAGLFEVVWAISMKYSNGLTRLWPTVATAVAMFISLFFLSQALKTLPVGTAYGVWTGIGAVGTAVLGIVLFGESREIARLLCIGLIIAGIVGLKIVS
jgi:quaternary ammonium compound-resistance protein SugE